MPKRGRNQDVLQQVNQEHGALGCVSVMTHGRSRESLRQTGVIDGNKSGGLHTVLFLLGVILQRAK